jgi:DNA-binding CsgD family transcriptional regulator
LTLTIPGLDIYSLIRDMPGFVMIKDLHSNYLNANSNTVKEFGLKNSDHLFGYTDLTIPHPLSNNGQLYRNLDHEVIQSGEAMQGICTFPFHGMIRPYHFRKTILKDIQGNNIATYSQAQECLDPAFIQFVQRLIADNPLRSKTSTPDNFILNREYRGIQLSLLESSCLFYLIRQKTLREISALLNVSMNVISLSVEKIKCQLNITNIRDILDKSIEKGYLNIVPPGIFSQLQQRPESESRNTESVNFTHREMDCARLLMKGCKIKEIAAVIKLSPRTVETHLNNLKMKLACRDKVELVIKLKSMAI